MLYHFFGQQHCRCSNGHASEPFSPPSFNAAWHYQRALLLMSSLDEDDRSLIQRDVWEVISDAEPVKGQAARIKRMLYRARFAADAAGKGSRLQACDFGIDFSDAGGASLLPHAKPMVELGRMLVLRGACAQFREKWEEAAVIYFDALRMGRHLTRQRTLIEAVAGMSIQENAFHALAQGAADCPNTDAVARKFGLFEIMADSLVVYGASAFRFLCSVVIEPHDRAAESRWTTSTDADLPPVANAAI